MPSIHVGWSLLFAITFIRLSPSRWRFLSLLHPLFMGTVVVVTGNHYWADGAVSVVLLLLTFVLLAGWDALRRRVRGSRLERERPDERQPVPVA